VPIYEYECSCGQKMEFYRSMDMRHNVVCPTCYRKPQLLISLPSQHQTCISLTVIDGSGRVIGKRNDHKRTPMFDEFYGTNGEVMQRLHYSQEIATKDYIAEQRGDAPITDRVKPEAKRGRKAI